jgi:hypothetical protein
MISADALALWFLADTAERAIVVDDLLSSHDLRIIIEGDLFALERAHFDLVTRIETGSRCCRQCRPPSPNNTTGSAVPSNHQFAGNGVTSLPL